MLERGIDDLSVSDVSEEEREVTMADLREEIMRLREENGNLKADLRKEKRKYAELLNWSESGECGGVQNVTTAAPAVVTKSSNEPIESTTPNWQQSPQRFLSPQTQIQSSQHIQTPKSEIISPIHPTSASFELSSRTERVLSEKVTQSRQRNSMRQQFKTPEISTPKKEDVDFNEILREVYGGITPPTVNRNKSPNRTPNNRTPRKGYDVTSIHSRGRNSPSPSRFRCMSPAGSIGSVGSKGSNASRLSRGNSTKPLRFKKSAEVTLNITARKRIAKGKKELPKEPIRAAKRQPEGKQITVRSPSPGVKTRRGISPSAYTRGIVG